jgi:ABC-type nitrate/sulfonate/bicarbonate transport system substrate-binding protein
MIYRMRQSFRSALGKHFCLRCRILLVLIALVSTAGSGPSAFALAVVNASYPRPAPFYIPVAIALQQGFFCEQNLDVKLIATLGRSRLAARVSRDIDFTLPMTLRGAFAIADV